MPVAPMKRPIRDDTRRLLEAALRYADAETDEDEKYRRNKLQLAAHHLKYSRRGSGGRWVAMVRDLVRAHDAGRDVPWDEARVMVDGIGKKP